MSQVLRVLITDRPWPDLKIERDILSEIDAEVVEPAQPTASEIAALAAEANAIGVCWAPLPGELLERCDQCRIVARFGTGLDNIPVATATRLGIPVTYLPDYCVAEVADHTLSLVLGLLRNVPAFDRAIKAGKYDPNRFLPRRLSELTLGLVGFGRIGKAVAERALACGMRVMATSRSLSIRHPGVIATTLEDLLNASDIVSLHAPLSPDTHYLMNASRLSQMRATAMLVNTARGAIVDSAALLDALDRGMLAGAALDVFDPEPPIANDRLVGHPRVIATPHVAFRSHESLIELRTRAATQIRDALIGRRPEHVANPEVYGR